MASPNSAEARNSANAVALSLRSYAAKPLSKSARAADKGNTKVAATNSHAEIVLGLIKIQRDESKAALGSSDD
jgi:hypothetical protein